MAVEITMWVTEDGTKFEEEIDALKHENEVLRKRLRKLDAIETADRERDLQRDSYSGGHE